MKQQSYWEKNGLKYSLSRQNPQQTYQSPIIKTTYIKSGYNSISRKESESTQNKPGKSVNISKERVSTKQPTQYTSQRNFFPTTRISHQQSQQQFSTRKVQIGTYDYNQDINYWRNKCQELQSIIDKLNKNRSQTQLELELTKQIDQQLKKISELEKKVQDSAPYQGNTTIGQLRREIQQLKEQLAKKPKVIKVEKIEKLNTKIEPADLSREIENLKKEKEKMNKQIQTLRREVQNKDILLQKKRNNEVQDDSNRMEQLKEQL